MAVNRIFWYGAHKVLKRTELRQLRQLGYEVFNPAYITPVYDQSADLRIDTDQPTTLPADVFKELLAYDFFYADVSPRISELLNTYFDAAIVTINADWLKAFLAGFKGQVIYRIYGQHFSLSEKLIEIGLWEKLVTRDQFAIVPFAQESVEREQRWFLDLCAGIVPYQIPDDVFEYSGVWKNCSHRAEIATSIPNIQNPYFAAAYSQFNAAYPHRLFRIYGPQRATPQDSRIIGALERAALLERFACSAGFLYDYRDEVCYLPPIEMMEIGGPVLYSPGSLLSRFFHGSAPGLLRDRVDAETKIRRLLAGDRAFVGEVCAAQEDVRRRYDRAVVHPAFAETFRRLLGQAATNAPIIRNGAMLGVAPYVVSNPTEDARPEIWLLLHADGLVAHRKGKAFAFEGIPRVMDAVVEALTRFGKCDVVVTCTERSLPVMHDFFRAPLRSGRLRLRAVQGVTPASESDGYRQRLQLIKEMNEDSRIVCAIVPHYYLFPEALLLQPPTILYLPDYFPYLMPGATFDESPEKDNENKQVGIGLARRSSVVLTNSTFTANYLPEAGFIEPGENAKVVVAPLPLLGARRAEEISPEDERALQEQLAGRRFLFYPTANRPNKQLEFLLRVFALVRLDQAGFALVLTGNLGTIPRVDEAADRYGIRDHLVMLKGLDEGSLRWLYKNAAALCLTSTLEGNFPPQVLEALEYGTPIVATRLPVITEDLGGLAEELLLCEPLDVQAFTAGIALACNDRDVVLRRQAKVLTFLRSRNSLQEFYAKLASIIDPLLATSARG